MGRIRTLKPEFWTDGKVVQLSYAARLLFVGSWNFARCDEGHLDDDAIALKLKVLPADDVDADNLLAELIEAGLIVRYESEDGRSYLHIRRFAEHQRVDSRWNTRCPYCPLRDSSKLAETHRASRELGLGKEGKGKEGVREKHTSPPSEDDARFESFWITYPKRNGKRIGKAKALKVWARLTTDQRDLVSEGVRHYAAACDKGLTIAKDAFRWLRDGEYEEWLDPAQAPQKPGESRSPYLAESWGTPPPEDEPGCEHSTPICADCRHANIIRFRQLVASGGRSA